DSGVARRAAESSAGADAARSSGLETPPEAGSPRSAASAVEVAGQLQLVARVAGQLGAGPLVDDALHELGAELLVGARLRLEEAEAERVDVLVADVLVAGQLAGDRVVALVQPRELLDDRRVGAAGAKDALAERLQP